MLFPEKPQTAILLDRGGISLDSIYKSFLVNDLVYNNVQYKAVEDRPGFFCLSGNNGLMVTVEFIDRPAAADVLQLTLRSAFNRLVLCRDAEDRVRRHRAHILINVADAALLERLKNPAAQVDLGSLPLFQKRLAKLAQLTAFAMKEVPTALVHWTQSNELFAPEMFANAALNPVPGPLHIHPLLFGDAQKRIGIRTIGARHFIGHELLVEAGPIPWQGLYGRIVEFVQMATRPNGYIVPDGETFGPPDHTESYRVHHRPAEPGDVPILELEPLLHRPSGFQSPDYVPRDRTFDDRNIPPDMQAEDRAAQDSQRAELRGKRRLAELAGNGFEVRAALPRDDTPRPGPSWLHLRPTFGRKKPDVS